MNSNKVLSLSLALSLVSFPLAAMAGHGGGGGGGAHSGGGGGGGGARGGGAPRMEAPRAAAPRMEAPRAQAPRMEAPREMSRAPEPRSQTYRAEPARSMASQRSFSRSESALRSGGSQRFSSSGSAERGEPAEARKGIASGSIARDFATRAPGKGFPESSKRMVGMAMPGVTRSTEAVRSAQQAAEYSRMAPPQRDALMSRMSAPERAETISRMNPEQRAESMYKMSPTQRAQTLAQLSPQLRSSFMTPQAPRSFGNVSAEKRGNLIRVGAGALGAAGAYGLSREGANMSGNRVERAGTGMESGARERQSVSAAPAFARPRSVEGGRGGQLSSRAGSPLRYAAGATGIPRAGTARSGLAGALDPGGYIRRPGAQGRYITPAFARSQFASAVPNFGAVAAANYRNIVANRGAWPWQLPGYAPGWFNNGQWNNYWWQDGSNDWLYGPCWNNGWGGSLPWWMTLADLFPWGMNSDLGWVPYQNYYNGYTIDGETYPANYFAANGYCPTHYDFIVATGQFQFPGGFTDSLPPGYTAPITVSVQESVPNYNFLGQIVGYKFQTFNYNAYWNEQHQAYGYYDYREQFHWLTFPWLRSWSGYS